MTDIEEDALESRFIATLALFEGALIVFVYLFFL